MARGLPEAIHVGLDCLILLTGNLNQALHRFFSDLQIDRLQSLVNYLRHQKVAFSLHLEIGPSVRNTVEEGSDSKATGLNIGFILADVVGQSHHDSVLELLREIVRLQLFTDVADRRQ